MEEKEKRDYINSLKRSDLEATSSFRDLMSRAEKKEREREKTQEIEHLELKRRLMEESRKEKEQEEIKRKEEKEQKEYDIRKEKEQLHLNKKTKHQKKELNEESFETERERNKREKIERNEQIMLEKEQMKKQKNNGKKSFSMVTLLFFIFALLVAIGSTIYVVFYMKDNVNQLELIIQSGFLMIITLSLGLTLLIKEQFKTVCGVVTILLLTGFITINLLLNIGIVKLPTPDTIPDFTGKPITEVLTWGKEKNIEIEQSYEYSDTTPEYGIMSQNIAVGTILKDIKKINFVVSSGPNYDKTVVLPNMVGWNIDEVLKVINENFLNNVEINFVLSNDVIKDNVISQSIKGEIRRNGKLTLTVSLGTEADLVPIELIDLKNKTLFEATLWLKRNGIKYTLQYEFSDTVKKNTILNMNQEVGTTIDPHTGSIVLIVSKGAKIIVPDLMNMSLEDITKWIIENNLKIVYSDRYDSTVETGKIIEVNVKTGDEIEEGTTISIVTSKGQLRMQKFSSLNEFRDWASKYNIEIREEYEYHASIPKGSIIKFSINENDVISISDTIIVYISQGSPVKVPKFIGDTEATARTKCKNAGLSCTFTYTGYNSVAKGTVLTQNKKEGATLTSGSSITLGLSSGPASSFNIEISEAQLSIGNADGTIATLKSYFANKYPGVTFSFIKKASNTYNNAGFIHENSPIKDGSKVTQGNSYQIWITI